jgi:hypothetical protein
MSTVELQTPAIGDDAAALVDGAEPFAGALALGEGL